MATDRLLPICDLLMAAAHADGRLDQREADVVRELLADLVDGALPPAVDARIAGFDPKAFTLATAAAAFRGDPLDERKRLLYLVDAVQEADDELDLAESSFLAALAKALEVPADAVAGLTLEVEVEELKQALATVRRGPPPIPGRRGDDVDVDLD
ncbi:MAG: TerB family tellurite resistance protein [Myxococcales bacterium]|nr:TerB family tellurite resistance protein [Myxococcales bacterium]MBK7195058.1 TerB family tellurite resistance protein [Myxococcales bacterium]MBP6846733.1 TerB family tellurite resistance protein [Kofleriaceae bacterium]